MKPMSSSVAMKATHYKKFLIFVLLAGLMFTNLDREVLGLSMQSIKADLSLSDTELGFLTGIAFALFYSLLGFPLARLADYGDRVILIAVTAALCGMAVALCGAATTFIQLIVIRVAVAVGETGFIPTANSLIAESFSRAERPRALSTYLLGGPLSVVVGYFLGGWLIEDYGWRWAFVAMGCPGLLLAIVVWFGLKEPRRAPSVDERRSYARKSAPGLVSASDSQARQPSLREFLKIILHSRTFRQLLYSYVVLSFFDYGRGQWMPAFYERSFGISPGSLGIWLAVVFGVCGTVGVYLGGVLSARYAPNNERMQLRVMAGIYVISTILSICVYLTRSRNLAFSLTAVKSVISPIATAPFYAILQALVPERMRAQSTAFLLLVSNLVGMGFGPLAAGALSDALHTAFGEESLRYTLLALSPGFLWCAWHTWHSGNTVTADLAAVESMARHSPGRTTTREVSGVA